MKAAGVAVRFLSLMDVTLILLGVFMLILMHTDLRRRAVQSENPMGLAEIADVGFIYLYAGCHGEQRRRTYLLKPNGEIGREVRTDVADDIKEIALTREQRNEVVPLLIDGWDADWTDEKLAELERIWELPVIRVLGVQLPQSKGTR